MPNDPFYKTRRWHQCRKQHLSDHPWCAVCAILKVFTPATDVDHVVAKEKMDDPYDHAGLRSLCHRHHSQKTILTEGQHKGKRFVVTGSDGYPIYYGED